MKEIKTMTINGVTYALVDVTASRINDSVLGEDPWSAKKIVDTLAPAFTKTGSLVTCRPVEGYPLAVGADSDVTRCGSNLCSLGTVSFTRFTQKTNAVILPAGSYYFSAEITSADTDTDRCCVACYTMNDDRQLAAIWLSHSTGGRVRGTITLTEPTNRIFLYASSSYNTGAGDAAVFRDILIVPTTEQSTYTPFQGGTFAPGESIPALAGVNTLWADGEITVTGRADPAAILGGLTDA